MSSVFETVMGRDFGRLHPELRRRFSVGLENGEACTGRGTMDRIWHGGRHLRPFLALGSRRNILVPREGRDVPFTIDNVPYADGFGRETVSFVRTFQFPRRAYRFDAQMVLGPYGDRVIDYLGTHQHLGTDLFPAAEPDGSLVIRSGTIRFREGPVDVRVPAPITGRAEVRESFDETSGHFRIRVRVTNRYFGPLFGYEGRFTATYEPAAAHPGPQPVREERRA